MGERGARGFTTYGSAKKGIMREGHAKRMQASVPVLVGFAVSTVAVVFTVAFVMIAAA